MYSFKLLVIRFAIDIEFSVKVNKSTSNDVVILFVLLNSGKFKLILPSFNLWPWICNFLLSYFTCIHFLSKLFLWQNSVSFPLRISSVNVTKSAENLNGRPYFLGSEINSRLFYFHVRIYNPIKHIWWTFLRNQPIGSSRWLFSHY